MIPIALLYSLSLSLCTIRITTLQLTCSHPYQLYNNSLCLYKSSSNKNYCDAQDYCRSIRGELATGVSAVTEISLHLKWLEMWVGATDMLDERGSSSTGWRWTNGQEVPLSLMASGKMSSVYMFSYCIQTCRVHTSRECGLQVTAKRRRTVLCLDTVFKEMVYLTDHATVSFHSCVKLLQSTKHM